ncbi:MAG: YfhO family protein [Gemmatimonadota bacterium]
MAEGRRGRRSGKEGKRPGRRGSPKGSSGPGTGGAAPGSDPAFPAWLPAVLFIGLGLFVFREFVFSDRMLFGGDTLGLGYVARALYAEALRELGTIPLWAPHILGGTPFIEALSGGDSLYPPSVLLLMALEPYRALGWKLVLHVIAAGFFMFAWIRAIGASRSAAVLAGTAYMLAPFFVSFVHPGHDGKMFVTALTPLLFWAVEKHFTGPRIWTFSATALVVASVILTTHFQMAYFLFGGVGLFAIFRTVQQWRGTGPGALPRDGDADGDAPGGTQLRPAASRFGLFLAAAVVGAGIGGVQLIPAVDYVGEHSRRIQTTRAAAGESGVAWSSSWSIHPEEALSLIVPEFAGNNASGAAWAENSYWGRNAFKDNHEYAGLIVLLLAAVSFMGGPRRSLRLFFAGLAVVAFLFALGANTPVWRIFYEVVPGIRLFRAPSQALLLFGFGTVTLAGLGLDRLLELARRRDDPAWSGVLKLLGGTLAGLTLLALLISSGTFTTVWTSTIYSEIHPQRFETMQAHLPFMARGAWFAVLLAGAAFGLVWACWKGRLTPHVLAAALVALVAVDALRVDGTFVETLDFEEWAAPDKNIQAVLEREAGSDEPYRLLSFRRAGQDVRPALHGIELAAGHHPNDLSRYRELIGMVGSSSPQNLGQANIRRLLNVRYILWPDLEMGGSVEGPVVSRTTLADGRAYETMLADDGLPRARLVGSVTVKGDDEAVPYMLSPEFDPEREVVLPEPPSAALADGPVSGTVTWLERTPNRLRLEVESDGAALLVIADNWYPAWQASVNGEHAPVLRAYHTLRAVPVPAGSSTVELVYRSQVIIWSLRLSLLLTLAIGLALGWSALAGLRRKDGP